MVGRKPGKLVGLQPLGSSNLPLGVTIFEISFLSHYLLITSKTERLNVNCYLTIKREH